MTMESDDAWSKWYPHVLGDNEGYLGHVEKHIQRFMMMPKSTISSPESQLLNRVIALLLNTPISCTTCGKNWIIINV